MSAVAGRFALAAVLAGFAGLALNASALAPLYEPGGEAAMLQAVTGGADRAWLSGEGDGGAAAPLPRAVYGAGAWLLGLDAVRLLPRAAPDPGPGRPAFLHGADELLPFEGPARSVHLLRLLPVLMGLATLLVTARLGERLHPGSGWLAAALLACSPAVIARFTACTGPPVVLLTGALSLLALARLARAEGPRTRDGLLVGLALGAAQLCDPAAAWLLVLVPLALWLHVRREPGLRAAVATLDWVLLGLLPLAGPYWAYNLVHAGSLWAPAAAAGSGTATGTGAPLLPSLLTQMTRTVRAGPPLAEAWTAVAAIAVAGLVRLAARRRGVCPRLLVLLAAAAAVDVAALYAHREAVGHWLANRPAPHPALAATAALLAAGLVAACPRPRALRAALAALLVGTLGALAFRAQAHELGPAFWPPSRVRDPHFMVFDPLAPVPPERRLPTIRWVEPEQDMVMPAPPLLVWRGSGDPAARYTVHVTAPGLAGVLATYEEDGLALRDRFEIPHAFWRNLPRGVPVVCRVLRLPTLEEALSAAPGRLNVDQSLPLTLRREAQAR